MRVTIADGKNDLGVFAAREGAELINKAIEEKGDANVVFVTGKSQIQTLHNLTKMEVDWSRVNVYHLDEFVGLSPDKFPSSHMFLQEYFLRHIPTPLSYKPINSDPDKLEETLKDLNQELEKHPLDVAFICIGENGHLAFNDPPADFDTKDPYIVVTLEKRSKRQQVGEGWFRNLDEVPDRAITMSVHEILSAKHIIVSCPDQRKAKAVADTLFEFVSPLYPATALTRADDCALFLDRQSAYLVFGDRRK